MQLIWDGEVDSGRRAATLIADLQSQAPPPGVSVVLHENCRIDISTRSAWAFLTWAVCAVMIWLGLTDQNWYLLALAPFMAGAAVMQSFGRVSIHISDAEMRVFEGAAGIGRRLKIPLASIERVEYAVKRGRGGSTTWIVVNRAKFGRHLSELQIRFVIAFLLDAMGPLAA